MARVLVVDDNPDTCELLARVLRKAGHEAECDASAAAALARLRRSPPDLVVLDVMMPEMNGLEVLRQVRADPTLAGVTVIMFSALSDEKTRAEARRLGANGYVVKGVGWTELNAEIRRHVGGTGTAAPVSDGGGEPGPH